jgi:hypothetical protein
MKEIIEIWKSSREVESIPFQSRYPPNVELMFRYFSYLDQ